MFLNNLAELIKVKTLVTLAVVAAFVVKALQNSISEDNFMAVTLTIVAFYFGTQYERKVQEAAAKTTQETPEQ